MQAVYCEQTPRASSGATAMSELKSRLDLRFRARDLKRKDILSQSDGIVIVELQTGSHAFAEVGRTEVVQNNQ